MYKKLFGAVCMSILMAVGAAAAEANTGRCPSDPCTTTGPAVQPTPEVKSPGYLYKGISIGMMADEVRDKLGDPKEKTDPQDLYVFGEGESAQFLYDQAHKVKAIMITFFGKLNGAPTPKDVFGEDVPAQPDGGVSKMLRYPKAGYWISYNKIIGDESMVSIAMQKI